jgi:hypothetical protein
MPMSRVRTKVLKFARMNNAAQPICTIEEGEDEPINIKSKKKKNIVDSLNPDSQSILYYFFNW